MLDARSFPRATFTLRSGSILARGVLILLLAIVTASPAGAQGAGTGTWTQSQGNAGHDGVASSGPAPPYTQAWSFPVAPEEAGKHSLGLSAPIIDGDIVIAVGPTAVYAVNLGTGAQVWSVPRSGPPAAPAIAEDGRRRLLLFTDQGSDGTPELRAVDLRTQKDAWAAPMPLKSVSRSGVTVDGDTAFLGDADGNVYAVEVATGKARWTVSVGGESKGPLPVADGRVYVVPLSHTFPTTVTASVVALDASTGDQVWRYTPQPGPVVASLAAAGNGSVVVVVPQGPGAQTVIVPGNVLTLSASDGVIRGSARIDLSPFFFIAPAVAPDATYVVDFSGGLHAIATDTMSQSWQFQFNVQVFRCSPVVVGDRVLVGLIDGTIAAVDRGTGHLVWRSPHLPGVVGAIAVGSDVLVAAVGGNKGGLVAFRHDDHGTQVDEASPTVPRWGVILGTFAIAAVAVGVVIAIPLTLVARRVGPPLVEDGDDEDDENEDDDEDEDDDR
jgi:outer membrane protein assembly factor BamB